MKLITRNILSFQESNFFTPIREKPDYALLIAHSIRHLLLDDISATNNQPITSTMKLIVDKMSRLFFYKGNKYFSIAFPFTVNIEGNEVSSITNRLGKTINNKSVSDLLAILFSPEFKHSSSLIDFYIEPNGIETSGVSLLEEIFQFEPSYVRYDVDPSRQNGKLHPLHHFDINYSQPGTFKLGISNPIVSTNFEDLHNIQTDCYFLSL